MNNKRTLELLKLCVKNMKRLRQSVDADALELFDLTATALGLAASSTKVEEGIAQAALYMALCDECGLPACTSFHLSTGRVLIDGEDRGQFVNLCEDHIPADETPRQPTDCQRVSFHWPEGKPPSKKAQGPEL